MEKTKFTVKVLALVAMVPLLVFAEMRHTKNKTKKGPHGIMYEETVKQAGSGTALLTELSS